MSEQDELLHAYNEELIDEIEEEQKEDALEEEMEAQQNAAENLDSSEAPPQQDEQSVLKFLKEVLTSEDRFKTANLTGEELGKPNFSTRFWLNLSHTCEQLFGFDKVGEYCRMKARITTDTSLSREGFMVNTAVTQRKVREKKGGSIDFLKKLNK